MAVLNANMFSRANNVRLQNWYQLVVPRYPNLEFSVQSLPLPTEGNEIVEVHFANSKSHQAGKATFEGGSFNFMDVIDMDTETSLRLWRDRVYNPETGQIGYVDEYKEDIKVTLYDPKGVIQHIWTLYGAWPSSVNWGQLDYNANEKRQIELTITFDWGMRDF
jgi:hypothetical protein